MKWYHYPNIRTDLFVCSLQKERDFVESAYHYPAGIVKRLGLCRFDALLRPHETKRQLLLMPTWRTYAIERKTQAEFEQERLFPALARTSFPARSWRRCWRSTAMRPSSTLISRCSVF